MKGVAVQPLYVMKADVAHDSLRASWCMMLFDQEQHELAYVHLIAFILPSPLHKQWPAHSAHSCVHGMHLTVNLVVAFFAY